MALMDSTTTVDRAPAGVRRHVTDQLLVGTGQVLAGLGNLAFSVIAARVLDPGAFAQLTAFLSLALLIHVPAGSLAAGSALSDTFHDRARRRAWFLGGFLGAGLGIAVLTIGPRVGLARALALPTAVLPPIAGALSLARGRLYAARRHGRVVGSLVVEPASRLVVGGGLLLFIGAVGGATGVALGGVVALLVARTRPRHPGAARLGGQEPGAGVHGMWAFLALAFVQNQDVLLANALLPSGDAGGYAVLSVLGGAALFAVWNAPLVLMPRAAEDRAALPAALGVTVVVGGLATAVTALAAPDLVRLLVGQRYAGVAGILPAYVGAMALLGVSRVLAAARCARSRGRSTAVLTILVATAHVAAILLGPRSVTWIAGTTLTATTVLTAILAATVALPAPRWRPWAASRRLVQRLVGTATARVATIAAIAGLGVRLAITRGLWLDEAISVRQARMPFGQMLTNIATTDVHPPGHQVLLWGWIRLFGDGDVSVRIPFVLIGAALVPLLYLAGRDLFSTRVGAAAAVLGSVAPLAVWYSQETRMYSMYMLFSLLAMWGQARAMRDGRVRDWTLFGLGTAALLWTHYLAVLQVIVQQVVLIAFLVRERRAGRPVGHRLGAWLLMLLNVAIALLPLALFAHHQIGAYVDRSASLDATPSQAGTAAAGITGNLSVYRLAVNVVWALAGYHSNQTMVLLVALWPLAMLVALAALGRGPWRPATHVLVAAAIAPVVGLFLLGAFKGNLFEVRYVIGALPAMLLLLARATTIPRRRVGTVLAVTGLAVLSVVGLADQQLNANNPRLYAFDDAVQTVASEAGPDDVIAYGPDFLAPVVDYYAPDDHLVALSDMDPSRVRGRIFVVGSFLDQEPFAGEVGADLTTLEQQRTLRDDRVIGNVRIWTFS